jgi:peptidoglycan/LPS O-acetylase OafA/YrhL
MNWLAVKDEKLETLTSLRFFAASMVFVTHYGPEVFADSPFWIQGFARHGYTAVLFFFVLSGFVLAYNYGEPRNESGMKVSRGEFWIARFSRIYPVYFIALVLSFPALLYHTFVIHTCTRSEFFGSGVSVPVLLQAWIPPWAMTWNIPAWSLSVEAFFYFVFPWLVCWVASGGSRNMVIAGLACVWGCELVRQGLTMQLEGRVDISEHSSWYNVLYYFPLFHLPSFFWGMCLGIAFRRAGRPDTKWAGPGFNVVLVAVVLLLSLKLVLPGVVYSKAVLIPLFGVFIFWGAVASQKAHPILSRPWLIRLGDASYGFYILQDPCGWWFSSFMKKLGVAEHWERNLGYVLVLYVLIWIISLVSFEFMEKPARRRIRAWLTWRRQQQTAVAAGI